MKEAESEEHSAELQQESLISVEAVKDSVEADSIFCETNVSLPEVTAQEVVETETAEEEESGHNELGLISKSDYQFDTSQLTLCPDELVISGISSESILLNSQNVSSVVVDLNQAETIIDSDNPSSTVNIEDINLETLLPAEIQMNCNQADPVHLIVNIPEVLREEDAVDVETLEIDAMDITNTVDVVVEKVDNRTKSLLSLDASVSLPDIVKDESTKECVKYSESLVNEDSSYSSYSVTSIKEAFDQNHSNLDLHKDVVDTHIDQEIILQSNQEIQLDAEVQDNNDKKRINTRRSRLTKPRGKTRSCHCEHDSKTGVENNSKQNLSTETIVSKSTRQKTKKAKKKGETKSKDQIIVLPSRRSARTRVTTHAKGKIVQAFKDIVHEQSIEYQTNEEKQIISSLETLPNKNEVGEEKIVKPVLEKKVVEKDIKRENSSTIQSVILMVSRSSSRKNRKQKKHSVPEKQIFFENLNIPVLEKNNKEKDVKLKNSSTNESDILPNLLDVSVNRSRHRKNRKHKKNPDNENPFLYKNLDIPVLEKVIDKDIKTEEGPETQNVISSDLLDVSVNRSRNKKNRKQKTNSLIENQSILESIDLPVLEKNVLKKDIKVENSSEIQSSFLSELLDIPMNRSCNRKNRKQKKNTVTENQIIFENIDITNKNAIVKDIKVENSSEIQGDVSSDLLDISSNQTFNRKKRKQKKNTITEKQINFENMVIPLLEENILEKSTKVENCSEIQVDVSSDLLDISTNQSFNRKNRKQKGNTAIENEIIFENTDIPILEENIVEQDIKGNSSEIQCDVSSDLLDISANQSRNRKNRKQKKNALTENNGSFEIIDSETTTNTRRRSTRIKSLEERKEKEREVKVKEDKERLEKKEKVIESDESAKQIENEEKYKSEKLTEHLEIENDALPEEKFITPSQCTTTTIKIEPTVVEKKEVAAVVQPFLMEETIIPKPEKVKSRWRRSSEMDNFGGDIPSKAEMKLQEIPEETIAEATSVTHQSATAVATTSLAVTTSVIPSPTPVVLPALLIKQQTISLQPSELTEGEIPSSEIVSIPTSNNSSPVEEKLVPKLELVIESESNFPIDNNDQAKTVVKFPEVSMAIEIKEKSPAYEEVMENVYLSERKKSKCKKEVKRMVCDCISTKEDREMGIPACGEDCLNRLLMIECGSRCPTGDYCTNKRFQKHQYAKIEPFKTEKKGFGLRTLLDMAENDFVLEYVGEVLNSQEFKGRTKSYAKDKRQHYYFMALRSDEIIDATFKGNMSRFINHSCDPNCETQKWTVNGELRVGFFSQRFIPAGCELTFDYQFQRYGKEAQKCFCGSSKCRGFIGGDKTLPLKLNEFKSDTPKRKDLRKKVIYEDISLEEEIEKLNNFGGLKNREQTLTLSRLMVRAEDTANRLILLNILQSTTEQACLRLFLDYHGLSLIWSWMVDIGENSQELKSQILETLQILPIPNKNMLEDSKVVSVVQRWAQQALLELQKDNESDALHKEGENEPSSGPPSSSDTPSTSQRNSPGDLEFRSQKQHLLPAVKREDSNSSDSDISTSFSDNSQTYVIKKSAHSTPKSQSLLGKRTRANSESKSFGSQHASKSGSCSGSDNDFSEIEDCCGSLYFTYDGPDMIPRVKRHTRSSSHHKAGDNHSLSKCPHLELSSKETKDSIKECKANISNHRCDKNEAMDLSEDSSYKDSLSKSRHKSQVTDVSSTVFLSSKSPSDREESTKYGNPADSTSKTEIRSSMVAVCTSSSEAEETVGSLLEKGKIHPEDLSKLEDETLYPLAEPKVIKIKNMAAQLLESWSTLKEVFKIPKKEMQQTRQANEREADFQEKDRDRRDFRDKSDRDKERERDKDGSRYRDYDRDRFYDRDQDRFRGIDRDKDRFDYRKRHFDSPERDQYRHEPPNQRYRLEKRSTKRDVPTTTVETLERPRRPPLLPTPPTLTKEERRQLFALEVQQKEEEEALRKQKEAFVQQQQLEQQQLEQQLIEQQLIEQQLIEQQLLEQQLLEQQLLEQQILEQQQLQQQLQQQQLEQQQLEQQQLQQQQLQQQQLHQQQLHQQQLQQQQLQQQQLQQQQLQQQQLHPQHHPQQHPQQHSQQHPHQQQQLPQQQQETGLYIDHNYPHQYFDPSTGYMHSVPVTPLPTDYAPISETPPTPTPHYESNQSSVVYQPPGYQVTTSYIQPSPVQSFVAQQPPQYIPGQTVYYTPQGMVVQPAYAQSNIVPIPEQSIPPLQQVHQVHSIPVQTSLTFQQPVSSASTTPVPSLTADESSPPSPPKPKPAKLPPNWRTAKDPDGKTYYYHAITRQTQWDPPTWDNAEQDDMDLGTPTYDEPFKSKKKATTTAAADTSSEIAKKTKEAFRTKMSSFIITCLNPYRKPDCKVGRITTTEDFKHLARKLTHAIMAKELKHCRNVEDLECNENVKHKAKDFVKKYMAKFGSIYKKASSPMFE